MCGRYLTQESTISLPVWSEKKYERTKETWLVNSPGRPGFAGSRVRVGAGPGSGEHSLTRGIPGKPGFCQTWLENGRWTEFDL